jgi:hypothetical protein
LANDYAVAENVIATKKLIEYEALNKQEEKIKGWLKAPDPSTNFNNAQKKRHAGTGSWFLNHPSYDKWKRGDVKLLWLHGIPGCGKTILSSTIMADLSGQLTNLFPVLRFFFDFSDSSKQSLDALLCSLITQLYQLENCRGELHLLYDKYGRGSSTPSTYDLCQTLKRMINEAPKVLVIIDALDECKTRMELMNWLKSTHCLPHTSVIVTSRQEADIQSGIESWTSSNSFVPLASNYVNDDICSFVRSELQANDGRFRRWHSRPDVLNEIEMTLTKKAEGM